MTLEVVKIIDQAFKNRTLTSHGASRSIKVLPYGAHRAMLVFDLSASRKILTSKAFNGLNYFKPGVARLSAAGTPMAHIGQFYDETILFKEGEEHHSIKAAFNRILSRTIAELQAAKPQILRYFRKRKSAMSSPLVFSDAFVRLCFGLVIARLTSTPLRTVFRSLGVRRNVFFSYFHPPRQISANEALATLYAAASPPEKGAHGWNEHLLAQSLIIMGIDPMVGSICASIVDGRTDGLAAGVYRYCPTSFVSRICVEPVAIGDIEFEPGDVCYVSLMPASDETAHACPAENERNASLAFGVGVHACIGKHLSLAVLQMADEILDTVFSHGFDTMPTTEPDGAFLSFRDP